MKKPYPIQKHHARVFIMFVFSIIFVSIVGELTSLLMEYLFHYSVSDTSLSFGVAFMLYICWVTNVRWGWTENLIAGKKKYPQMLVWFEKVTGK